MRIKRIIHKIIGFFRFGENPNTVDMGQREQYHRYRARKSYQIAILLHLLVILGSLVHFRGCLYETPAGIPGGEGDDLPEGEVQPIEAPRVVRRQRMVRTSPITIFDHLEEIEEQYDRQVRETMSDSLGVPGGEGEGAAAAGSPRGTKLGGTLHFYRIRFDGPGWDSNRRGTRALMDEVLDAGVVQDISGRDNVVRLRDLDRHKDQYLPAMVFMTGTGRINANSNEIENMREYLYNGGMLFADVSGGNFFRHFRDFIREVLPDSRMRPIEYDNEIFSGGRGIPYSLGSGAPIYRNHSGAGPALGVWHNGRIVVFFSRGDISGAWDSGAAYGGRRRRAVEQAYRMGVNAVAYGLLYYKHGVE